jgi:RimJ/RimL family protein N-acetyltransferase
VPYWGEGYATEAAAALVAWGFDILDLQRIHAAHFTRNPASGRVMQKIGMTFEGIARQHVLKHDRWEDMARYGIVRGDPRPSLA